MGAEAGPAPDFVHATVLCTEALHFLQPRSGGIYVDMTLGGGGHSQALLEASVPDGVVIGLDRDPTALLAAGERLKGFGARFIPVRSAFSGLSEVLKALQVPGVDGVLMDLGVSSPQLDVAARGFSFRLEGPLDMRMDPEGPQTAAALLESLDEKALAQIFWEYGEERFSRPISREIVKRRASGGLRTTRDLAALVTGVVPYKGQERIHPATRVFQALRIAVNDELGELARGLEAVRLALRPGGRLVAISFHSLEDRIVKQFMREQATDCLCPPRTPVCVCGHSAQMRLLTRKPVEAGELELQANPRARSARLRAAEQLESGTSPAAAARPGGG